MAKTPRFLVLCLLLGLPFLSAAFAQGVGSVIMSGQIQETACSIHTGDMWQEIPFGVVSWHDIHHTDKSVTKPFVVRLVNCSLARSKGDLWQSVNIMFAGETELYQPELFKVHGKATGLGLRIHHQTGEIAHSGEPMPHVYLHNDNNELRYLLSLAPNGKLLLEGDWYGIVHYMVAYQ